MRPSDVTTLTRHDPALHGQLVDRAAKRLASGLLVGVAHLEQHPSGLDVGHPLLRRTLAGTHAGLGRLLGERAVREHVDPDLAATADVPVDRDTRRLDLPVGDVGRLERLDAQVAEADAGATSGRTG